MRRHSWFRAWVATGVGLCLAAPARGVMSFDFTPQGGTSQQAIDGFTAAGARFSALFDDPVTVNVTIGFSALGAGILAQAGSSNLTYSYSAVRDALAADATSASDATAVAALPAGNAVNMLINYTSDNPNGSGSATPYYDNDGNANNTTLRLNRANAKALGLLSGSDAAEDASITFSTAYSWDFDPSNGITPGAFDFIGIAVHEIGHALGFVSGVDILDTNSPPSGGPFSEAAFTYVSALDLYRYSAASHAFGDGVIDWTANATAKYFSIDGGDTSLLTYSTGTVHGDGQQASHWKDSLGYGIMDPTAAFGETLVIGNNDLLAFDVIGWDLIAASSGAAPEPAGLALLPPVLFLLHRGGRRARSHVPRH